MKVTPLDTLTRSQKLILQGMEARLMQNYPFFAAMRYGTLKMVPASIELRVDTALAGATAGVKTYGCTDGQGTIWLDPDELARLTPQEQDGVYLHEIAHVIMQHGNRGLQMQANGTVAGKPFDPETLNIAEDCIINELVDQTGHHLPEHARPKIPKEGCRHPDVQSVTPLDVAYAKVWEDKKGGGGGGSGQHGSVDGHAPPANPDNPMPGQNENPLSPEEFEEKLAGALEMAKNSGDVPGSFKETIEKILKPKIDWQEQLRTHLQRSAGATHADYRRPRKRQLLWNPPIVYPSRRGEHTKTTVVCIDTSGSMSQADMQMALGTVASQLEEVNPERVIVIQCDTRIVNVAEIRSMEDLEQYAQTGAHGRGGTSFIPPFQLLEKGIEDGDYPDVGELDPEDIVSVTYVTDLDGPFPKQAPTYDVLWLTVETDIAPFGTTVRMEF